VRFFNQLRDQISLSLENFPVLLIFGVNGSLFSVLFLLSLDQVYCILDISYIGRCYRRTEDDNQTRFRGPLPTKISQARSTVGRLVQ